MTMLETSANMESSMTAARPFFYDLQPLIGAVLEQAARLEGEPARRPDEFAPLERAVSRLDAMMNPLIWEPETRILLALTNSLRVPNEYATPIGRTRRKMLLDLPVAAVTAVRANPRLENGPNFHAIIEDVWANPPHGEPGATCRENHCICHLADIDVDRLVVHTTPVLDVRVVSDGQEVTVYDETGQLAEVPSLGRWYRFPLSLISQTKLFPFGDAEQMHS